jgi:hypothetical protein
MKRTFRVVIEWGTEDTRRESGKAGRAPYEFETAGERDAFLLGVDEASGWMDYEVIEP